MVGVAYAADAAAMRNKWLSILLSLVLWITDSSSHAQARVVQLVAGVLASVPDHVWWIELHTLYTELRAHIITQILVGCFQAHVTAAGSFNAYMLLQRTLQRLYLPTRMIPSTLCQYFLMVSDMHSLLQKLGSNITIITACCNLCIA